jgi:hypothetical protein
MDRDEPTIPKAAPDAEEVSKETEVDTLVEIVDEGAASESPDAAPSAERPVSTTIGTGSFFGIGCTIFALLFVCVGVAIFMWRQVN